MLVLVEDGDVDAAPASRPTARARAGCAAPAGRGRSAAQLRRARVVGARRTIACVARAARAVELALDEASSALPGALGRDAEHGDDRPGGHAGGAHDLDAAPEGSGGGGELVGADAGHAGEGPAILAEAGAEATCRAAARGLPPAPARQPSSRRRLPAAPCPPRRTVVARRVGRRTKSLRGHAGRARGTGRALLPARRHTP